MAPLKSRTTTIIDNIIWEFVELPQKKKKKQNQPQQPQQQPQQEF